ncbi:C69 family dipeptidase [Companilactobacillus sp.]|jgi:dipeptidase|uniref:C69 family dipeptidase n=1 Tax=Companilactobacillus sp. TaxID=2767905 RepID=UPI0025C33474|nr:C69 family dipeptidase [Companilactobacillus sp.]MCH4008522.1 C69 family dipeptidase [Companilactobacillus sp.]MCH4051299.1 C69 family dipeptidase [Companilactobacillus sp.]MCH4076465.1 C69 family dipeptidase [Companilactobacillus sp.]MCH4125040.1 C69 family dipeptidase [Companilactobacillus sp.]MCH4131581.1 C69 family dipeptidase [Companilactobacillus sp.]
MTLEYNKGSLSACTSILVGKKASIGGSTMIGRNEDAKTSWPKHFVVHPYEEFEESQKYVSKENGFEMKLPKKRFKYTATPEWTDKEGLFEEDGFNEFGVAMSATESAYSNQRVLGVDPLVENGIGEEAMVTVVLPYVKTARQGVERLGQIIEKHGTSETNGVLFSDQNEVWYFENGSGHNWVAQRIPDDSYAVVANQLAIQDIDFNDPDNFLYKKDIQGFVNDYNLNPYPNSFNFRKIFGTHDMSDAIYSTPRVWWGQQEFSGKTDESPESQDLDFIKKADRLLSVDDVQNYLSSHFQGTEFDPLNKGENNHRYRPISLAKTQESHVLQIRPDLKPEIACVQWLSMGVSAQSVYVPFYMGIEDTPEEYQIGGLPYDSKSAYWTYKLAGVLLDGHYQQFGAMFEEKQKEINITLRKMLRDYDIQALAQEDEDLPRFLTAASYKMSKTALDAYKELTAKLITDSTDFSPLNFKTDMNL